MTRSDLLSSCAYCAVGALSLAAAPAQAAGTAAGTVITNQVTVDYTVGGVNQNDVTASTDVTVDRKVDVTVAATTDTSVTPGAANQAVGFIVTNLSNDALDFQIGAAQAVGDDFDVTAPLAYYRDDTGAGTLGQFDAADDAVTHIDALAADGSVRIFVVTPQVPGTATDSQIAGITLTATARANDGGATLGAALANAASNTAGVDTIFADGQGISDGVRDAAYSATEQFVVATAAITATKASRVIAGVNEFAAGAAIPGATVEFCITVSNNGSASATALTITDTLPGALSFADGVWVGGADCNTRGADTGSEAGGTVTGTIGTLAVGASQTVIFEATIN